MEGRSRPAHHGRIKVGNNQPTEANKTRTGDAGMEGGRRPANHGCIKVGNNEFVYFEPTAASIANTSWKPSGPSGVMQKIDIVYSEEDTPLFRVDSNGVKVRLPPCKENWRGSNYVKDSHGYEYTDDHFRSDDEVSEDGDDAEKKESAIETTSAGVACMTDKLSAMDVGRSTSRDRIILPPHDPKSVFLVTFDGHHKKNSNGGYGALLRCHDGRPVAAVAGGSQRCISAFYHNLEGFLTGIRLAVLANVPAVFFACNSKRVFETLWECFMFNNEGRCRNHPGLQFDLVCRTCLIRKLTLEERVYKDYFDDIVRLIVAKGQRYYRSRGMLNAYLKEWNRPADFLAKMVDCPGEEKRFLQPNQFPDELKDLLSKHEPEILFHYT